MTVVAAAAALVTPVAAHAGVARPGIKLAHSAVVLFEVRRTEQMQNFEQFGGAPNPDVQIVASSTERYTALYFPDAKAGWVQLRDPAAPKAPPLVAPIGSVNQEGFTFQPHHMYSVAVAIASPGRITFPGPDYRILGVRKRDVVKVGLTEQALPVPGGSSSAVAGFAPIDLATAQASMVALSVDYQKSSNRATDGDACAAPTPAYGCALDRTGWFSAGWGQPGAAGQDTVGRAFASAPAGSYVTGSFAVLAGSSFQAARLIAFGLQIDQ